MVERWQFIEKHWFGFIGKNYSVQPEMYVQEFCDHPKCKKNLMFVTYLKKKDFNSQ